MTQNRKWTAGTAAVIVLLLVAGWLLVIAPTRGEAAEARSLTAEQNDANSSLRTKIEMLKVQSADLPAQEARLAEMATQIPADPALPTLIRDLTAAAEATGVVLVSLAPSPPEAVSAAVPVPVAPSPSAAPADGGAGDAAAAAPAAPVSPPAPAPALFKIGVSLNVTGDYFQVEQFVNKLEELKRSFQVTNFTLASDTTAVGSSSKNPLTLVLNGRVFVAPVVPLSSPTAPVAVAPGAGTTEAPVDGSVPPPVEDATPSTTT